VVYFIFGYFSTKLGTSVVDGHENITWKFQWNRPRNKWFWANIVPNFYFGKCTGKRYFRLIQIFLFLQTILTAQKIRFKKNQASLWLIQYSICSRYPNICDRTKRIRIGLVFLYSPSPTQCSI
jgi:hypothetical protein